MTEKFVKSKNMQRIICFDIGGTKIAMAVIEFSEKDYKFLDLNSISNPIDPEKIKNILLDYCQKGKNEFKTSKVAIATAKIVNPDAKKVLQAAEIYGAEEFDFSFLQEAGSETKIENDGRCFSLGEYHFGQGKGSKSLLAITLGTDIGGGLLINGAGYQGAHYSSLEISHIRFSENGEIKSWRDLAGGRAIEKIYNENAGGNKSAADIFSLAKNGDETARKIIKNAEQLSGISLANLVTILDPETIIIGGSIAVQEGYVGNIFKIAEENTFNRKAEYVWKISELKEKANLLGAAKLYF